MTAEESNGPGRALRFVGADGLENRKATAVDDGSVPAHAIFERHRRGALSPDSHTRLLRGVHVSGGGKRPSVVAETRTPGRRLNSNEPSPHEWFFALPTCVAAGQLARSGRSPWSAEEEHPSAVPARGSDTGNRAVSGSKIHAFPKSK